MEIIVRGKMGEGKSAISAIIAKTLIEKGFIVEIADVMGEPYISAKRKEYISRIIEEGCQILVRKNSTITIKQEQLMRTAK